MGTGKTQSEMRHELTPFDAELFEMIYSLTGFYPVMDDEYNETFQFAVDYSDRPEPDFVNGLINAIRGRLGNRFKKIYDYPDLEKFVIDAEWNNDNLPAIVGSFEPVNVPSPEFGKTYCRQLEEIQALQVERDNDTELICFCGGGQMAIEKKPNGKCIFTFINNGVFVDVAEHDYIVKRNDKAHLEIWHKAQFEKEFEPK